MDFTSNLTAPDLRPYFRYLNWRAMPHSFGHLVASDWVDKAMDDPIFGIYKNCGLWTHDEVAILYQVACNTFGSWVDIGAHTGWTTAHIGAACFGSDHIAIDPMLTNPGFLERFWQNTRGNPRYSPVGSTSEQFFRHFGNIKFVGFCIDGDHGKPLEDAINAAKHLADTGVIIFHDGVGKPVREAVQYLMAQGFHCRPYFTPHMIFLCWRGDFTPPDHVPDPNVKAQLLDGRLSDFKFEDCE